MKNVIIDALVANPRLSNSGIAKLANCHVREVNQFLAEQRETFLQSYNAQKQNAIKNAFLTH